MNQNSIKLDFEQGALKDVYYAQYHYLVFRYIGEHAETIRNSVFKDSLEQRHIVYLQTAGQEGAILALCRFYDKKSKNYPTVCIQEIVRRIRVESSEFENGIIPSEELDMLKKFSRKWQCQSINSKANLIKLIDDILSDEQLKKEIGILRTVRDKNLAHTELILDFAGSEKYWCVFEKLLRLARLMNFVISNHFFEFVLESLSFKSESLVEPSICSEQSWLHEILQAYCPSIQLKYLTELDYFDH